MGLGIADLVRLGIADVVRGLGIADLVRLGIADLVRLGIAEGWG